MIGAFAPFDRIVYTAAPASYPTEDIWYVSADTTIVIEFEQPEPCKSTSDYGCDCTAHVRKTCASVSTRAQDVQLNYFGTPFEGDVAKFYYPSVPSFHIACVEDVYLSGNFLVSECNYEAGKCGTRIVLLDDPNLLGFLHNIRTEF